MSIENTLQGILNSLVRMEQHLIGTETASPEPEIPTAAVLVPTIPAPSLDVPLPTVAATLPNVVSLPPSAPQGFIVPTGIPFTTIAGLIEYATAAYTQIGMEKGAKIQGILHDIGYADIKTVAPEHFGAFYAKIEELKRS